MEHIKAKDIAEAFNYQSRTVKPIDDQFVANNIEQIVRSVRGHSTLTVGIGDTIFKYFIKTPNGELFLKYGKTVSGIVEELTKTRNVTAVDPNLGVPIFSII
jgi:hypothetical protein